MPACRQPRPCEDEDVLLEVLEAVQSWMGNPISHRPLASSQQKIQSARSEPEQVEQIVGFVTVALAMQGKGSGKDKAADRKKRKRTSADEVSSQGPCVPGSNCYLIEATRKLLSRGGLCAGL